MAQVIEFLLLVWETWIAFPATSFSPPMGIWEINEPRVGTFSVFLCFSNFISLLYFFFLKENVQSLFSVLSTVPSSANLNQDSRWF